MSIPQEGIYHFCVLNARTAKDAFLITECTLANEDSRGSKKLKYEVGNVLNTDVKNYGTDRLLRNSSEFTTIYHIDEYIWARIITIPWEVKVPGDISLIKHNNGHELLEEDWEAIYQYSLHQREKYRHQKIGFFDLRQSSIFDGKFDDIGVTNIMNNDPEAIKQYIVVLKNFDCCVLA